MSRGGRSNVVLSKSHTPPGATKICRRLKNKRATLDPTFQSLVFDCTIICVHPFNDSFALIPNVRVYMLFVSFRSFGSRLFVLRRVCRDLRVF
jgi:hypothetical protein